MDGPAWAIAASLLIAAASSVFGLIQATKATRASMKANQSNNSTKVMELGVRDLIDQYRERNEELLDDVHECTGKCSELERQVSTMSGQIRELELAVARGSGMIAEREQKIAERDQKIAELTALLEAK